MPELPEVETVCRGLARTLPRHVIRRVEKKRGGLRVPFPADLGSIRGRKIAAIARRAKYILAHLSGGRTLILHLGMSGRLTVAKNPRAEKHDHLILTMDDGATVTLNDPRRFGLAALADTKDLEKHKFFAHLGPEPFDRKFTAAWLAEKLKSKKIAVKLAIMDQRLVVGVGNIYASEALFAAGIDPRRPARSLKPAEIKKLAAAIRNVLRRAIRAGGSSLRDYVQADGALGYFQHHWAVYGKEGERCRGCTCKTAGVKRIIQGGRSTFYCPVKQK